MKKVSKPIFDVKEIVYDCAESLRNDEKKNRIKTAASIIAQKSIEYDDLAQEHSLSLITEHNTVANNISKEEYLSLYDQKFVCHKNVRPKYYDKIMLLTNGRCPMCDVGQVGNLDHFLSKSLFPTYTLTPYNLIPICRDCNYEKREQSFNTYEKAPFHPYYDESDDVIWLKAALQLEEGGIVASYYVDSTISDERMIEKYRAHMEIFKLYKKYAIEAAREIADNYYMWKNGLDNWGENAFIDFINSTILSLEKHQKNSWKIALYRAIIENISVLKDA